MTSVQPAAAEIMKCGSLTSPAITSTDFMMSAETVSSQPQELKELYSTTALTFAPARTSSSTTCEPMNPSLPVTSTRASFRSSMPDPKKGDYSSLRNVIEL